MSINGPLLVEIPERRKGEGTQLALYEELNAKNFAYRLDLRGQCVEGDRLRRWVEAYKYMGRMAQQEIGGIALCNELLLDMALAIRVLSDQYRY